MTDAPDTPPNPWIKRARIAGQITAGLILGAHIATTPLQAKGNICRGSCHAAQALITCLRLLSQCAKVQFTLLNLLV